MTTIIDGGHGIQLHVEEGEPKRRCGDCRLCCSLLPVRSVNKPAGAKCVYQSHARGCKVYAKLMSVSPECRLWSCRWVLGDAGETRRPDRVHYCVDVMPDFVTLEDEEGKRTLVEVVQIWIDPSYPDAHRDPALRAWLDRQGKAGLVRYDDQRALVIVPPSASNDGQWHERASNRNLETPHSVAEVVRALSGRDDA